MSVMKRWFRLLQLKMVPAAVLVILADLTGVLGSTKWHHHHHMLVYLIEGYLEELSKLVMSSGELRLGPAPARTGFNHELHA